MFIVLTSNFYALSCPQYMLYTVGGLSATMLWMFVICVD